MSLLYLQTSILYEAVWKRNPISIYSNSGCMLFVSSNLSLFSPSPLCRYYTQCYLYSQHWNDSMVNKLPRVFGESVQKCFVFICFCKQFRFHYLVNSFLNFKNICFLSFNWCKHVCFIYFPVRYLVRQHYGCGFVKQFDLMGITYKLYWWCRYTSVSVHDLWPRHHSAVVDQYMYKCTGIFFVLHVL